MRTTITLAILAAGVARASIIYGPTQQSLSVDLYAARPETPLVPHGQFTDGASNNTATDWSDTVTGKIEYTEFDSINYIGSATASSQSTFGTDSISYAGQTVVNWFDFGGAAVGHSTGSGILSVTFQLDAPMYFTALGTRGASAMSTLQMSLTGPGGSSVFDKDFNLTAINESGWLSAGVDYTWTVNFGDSPVYGGYSKEFTSSLSVSAVPEPGETAAAVGLGCVAVGLWCRRRNR